MAVFQPHPEVALVCCWKTLQVDTAALLHFLAGWDLIAGDFAASGVAEPSAAPTRFLETWRCVLNMGREP